MEDFVKTWFGGSPFQEYEGYGLSIHIVSRKKRRIVGGATVIVRVLVVLHGNEINFPLMKESVLHHPSLFGEQFQRVNCNWVVLSGHGGIYLYEALAEKSAVRCVGMRNRFLVINSEDGSFSFGPGHVLNREYTEAMQDLLTRMKTIPPAVFIRKFESIMECSLAELE